MAYEGKYLRAQAVGGRPPKAAKKKGRVRPWMIVVAVVLVLAIAIGVGGYTYYKSLLGNVNRAEYEEKNQDVSFEEALKLINGSNNAAEDLSEDEAPEETQ